ncbi:hypothetical protein [Lacibacter cauensis]|nr:hypothetical protein [Lacibacter cauensis]
MSAEVEPILPCWTILTAETTASAFHVVMVNRSGQQVAATDTDRVRAMHECERQAFAFEQQHAENRGRFLFEYSLLKLAGQLVTEQRYQSEVFGSWYVVCNNKRLIYDGRDNILLVQNYVDNHAEWGQYRAIAIKDLAYDDFHSLIQNML